MDHYYIWPKKVSVSILVLMDSRIKIQPEPGSPQASHAVSILVLMDSRIKIGLSYYLPHLQFHVSILVLMDSRIKIGMSYIRKYTYPTSFNPCFNG